MRHVCEAGGRPERSEGAESCTAQIFYFSFMMVIWTAPISDSLKLMSIRTAQVFIFVQLRVTWTAHFFSVVLYSVRATPVPRSNTFASPAVTEFVPWIMDCIHESTCILSES